MLGGGIGAGGARAPQVRRVDEPGGDVARATRDARWSGTWRGWAPWRLDHPTLWLAAAAVALDVATAWLDLTLGHLGRIPVSPALALGVLVAARIGACSLGCSGDSWRAWREYGLVVGAVLAAAIAAYALDLGGAGEACGLLVAALGEELVYRLAAVVVAGAALATLAGRDWRDVGRWGTGPGVGALLAAAVLFTALPGHVAQIDGASSFASFASLALVLGWVVLRTGALWPAVAAHCLVNLATIAVLVSGGAAILASAFAGSVLLALVAGADVAARRAGRFRRVPSVIDLTRA